MPRGVALKGKAFQALAIVVAPTGAGCYADEGVGTAADGGCGCVEVFAPRAIPRRVVAL